MLRLITAVLLCAGMPALPGDIKNIAPGASGIVFTRTLRGEPPQLALLDVSGQVRVLSQGLHAAADPAVSFDGKRIIFAAQRRPGDIWQVFELTLASGDIRQITQGASDCRQPIYQSRVFSLDIPLPWYQVAYVSEGSIHSVKLDGSLHQRLTFAPSRDTDPLVLPDGRMIYSSQSGARRQLFGVNLDGTDYDLFVPGTSLRMPAVTDRREVVFVEGAGQLAAVHLDRPLHTRKALTLAGGGIYSTPAPLPGGSLLVSWKPSAEAQFALFRFEPETKKRTPVLSIAGAEITHARLVAPHEEPEGRGSVVDDSVNTARLYCLSAFTTDAPALINKTSAKRVRVLGGPVSQPQTLGEADLEDDGSFHLEIPPNKPLKLQILSSSGAVLRTSGWIFVRNKENRGCIGCHEDRELSPDNREAKAVTKKAVSLVPPVHGPSGGAR